MSRRLFISDLHLSRGDSLVAGYAKHRYDWCDASDQKRFIAFLEWAKAECDPRRAGERSPVTEVVLLGDMFDNWVYPHDEKPPTLRELLASPNAAPVVSALNDLAKTVPVVYLPGNHDITLDEATLKAAMPAVVHGGDGTVSPYFTCGRVRAEHGNASALCCATDPNRPQGLPLGYFVSRLAATADRNTGSRTPNLATVMHEFFEACGHERIGEGVIDAVCKKTGVTLATKIEMPDDIWGGAPVPVGLVRQTYGRIFEEWRERRGELSAIMAIPAELGALQPAALARFRRRAVTAVIMGHTHHELVETSLTVGVGFTVFANTGCFCRGKGTWVEVRRDGKAATQIWLMQWADASGTQPPGPKTLIGPTRCE